MGSIYGTTTGGGLNQLCLGGCGVVFKLTGSHGNWIEMALPPTEDMGKVLRYENRVQKQ